MKLTSNFPDRVFWRTFDRRDTVYVFGRFQGFLSTGESVQINDQSNAFQLEIKRGGLGGSFILRPSIYTNDLELVLTASGQLQKVEDFAQIITNAGVLTEPYFSVTQFMDRLTSPTDVTYKIKTSVSSSITQSGERGTKLVTGVEDESGSKIGGDASAEIPFKEYKFGIKLDAEVSQTVRTKLEREVTQNTSFSIARTETSEEERTETFVAWKLHVITSS